ncbi:MAG TPA: hypothetical protein VGV15_01905 [Terriglobales bacterium]|nr:hypothetical protein [Terriglobales bacterium]
MLRALAAGETNPRQMADLAKRQLRKKIPALQLALDGCLLPHHRFLLTDMLEELDHIGSKIAPVEQVIEQQMRPYQKAVDAWMTVSSNGWRGTLLLRSVLRSMPLLPLPT